MCGRQLEQRNVIVDYSGYYPSIVHDTLSVSLTCSSEGSIGREDFASCNDTCTDLLYAVPVLLDTTPANNPQVTLSQLVRTRYMTGSGVAGGYFAKCSFLALGVQPQGKCSNRYQFLSFDRKTFTACINREV